MDELRGYDRISPDERAGLTALCTEYCWRADNYRAASIPELFADDAVWEAGATTLSGRDELVSGWRIRAASGTHDVRRHLLSNLRFVRDDDGVLRGRVTFSLFRRALDDNSPAAVELVGEWIDTYTGAAGGSWLFQSRKVTFLFPFDWVGAPIAPKNLR
jgi:hypothetical protein